MTITRRMLDTKLEVWFHNKSNAEEAKDEILKLFSKEPEDYVWTQQDICEQSRKIIDRWDHA